MFVVSVTIWVKTEHIAEFISATLENARNSRREPGNLRFDLNQSVEDNSRFHLYEVYHDEEGFKAHQSTEHYVVWRETVAEWMAQPRQGLKYYSLFPDMPDWLDDEEEE